MVRKRRSRNRPASHDGRRLIGERSLSMGRRQWLATVGGAGTFALSGCTDLAGAGGTDCIDWADTFEPYHVSGKRYPVVPSFPTDWEEYGTSFDNPTTNSVSFAKFKGDDSLGLTNFYVKVRTDMSPDELRDYDEWAEEWVAIEEEVDPVTFGDQERRVGTGTTDNDQDLLWQFTAESAKGNPFMLMLQVGGGPDCYDVVRPLGRAVLDRLEPNSDSTY